MAEQQNDGSFRPTLRAKLWSRTLDKRPASAGMYLEDDEGRLLVVKAHYKKHWSLPGGIIDKGEMPLVAALREVKEEVGLTIPAESATFRSVIARRSKLFNSYQFVFAAPLAAGQISEIKLQASEITEYALVTKDQVRAKDRHYGRVIHDWAKGTSGYREQELDG